MRQIVLIAVALLGCACSEPAEAGQPRPHTVLGVELTGRIVDAANILDEAAEKSLTAKLAQLETETTDQLVVVTLPDLRGRTIEEAGLAFGRGWGIGRADIDNGVLLIVALHEKKVRIEVGMGLEALLTDALAGAIIREMLPYFRSGDIAAGIRHGTDRIATLLSADRRRPRFRNEARMRKAA